MKLKRTKAGEERANEEQRRVKRRRGWREIMEENSERNTEMKR